MKAEDITKRTKNIFHREFQLPHAGCAGVSLHLALLVSHTMHAEISYFPTSFFVVPFSTRFFKSPVLCSSRIL